VKIITKYVLREHLGPLLFALTALTSLLLLNYIAKRFGELVGKGLPWSVILEFFTLSVPFTVAMTLPMAVLVSTLYAFSRLAAENEITALKASGVSMARLMRPVLVGALLVAGVMLFFNDRVLPRSNHRLRILQGDIARKKPTFLLREQVINDLAGGRYYIRANHISRDNHMREVVIYDLADPVRRRTIYADSGNMAMAPSGDLLMTLWDGYMQEIPKDEPTNLQRLFFTTDRIRIAGVANQLERSEDDTYKSDREMSVCEMHKEVSDRQVDFAVARHHMEQALVAATRSAATGTEATIVQEQQAPSVGYGPERPQPGRTIIPPGLQVVRRTGAVGLYCEGLRRFTRLRKQLTMAATPATAWAATPADVQAQGAQRQDTIRRAQGQDTTRRPTIVRPQAPDTGRVADSLRQRGAAARQRADSMRRVADSLALTAAAARGDTATRLPVDSIAAAPVAGVTVLPQPPAASDSAAGPTPVDVPVAPIVGAPVPNVAEIVVTPAMVTATLEAAKSRMVDNRREMDRYGVEIHKKFALSVACIVFVLIGAPIALRFPRGGVGLVIGVSLSVFALYYVGLIGGESLANEDYLPPFLAMWSANLILTAVGLVLLARMGREASTARGGDLGEVLDLIRLRFGRRRSGAVPAPAAKVS
jgi:lipopolysaccharide export system permease protein